MGWGRGKKHQALSVSCCIRDDGISLAAVNVKRELVFCEHLALADDDNDTILNALSQLSERSGLTKSSWRWVLASNQYQLLMTDNVDVPEDELVGALSFRLKGLIQYPAKDVSLDAFVVPPHGMGNQLNKVFVVASQQSFLLNQINVFELAMIDVSTIDISALAMRNIVASCDDSNGPQIVVSLELGLCHISILFRGDIYLVRELAFDAIPVSDNTEITVYQQLLLEIQRSMDFCLSELKLAEPTAVLFTPKFFEHTALITYLNSMLSANVSVIDFNRCLAKGSNVPAKTQHLCANSLGSALHFLSDEGMES